MIRLTKFLKLRKSFNNSFFFPVSRTASGESSQKMEACAVARALANLAEVWELSERSGGEV